MYLLTEKIVYQAKYRIKIYIYNTYMSSPVGVGVDATIYK